MSLCMDGVRSDIARHDGLMASLWLEAEIANYNPEKVEAIFDQMDESAKLVGEAFYQATKDRNCRSNCLLGCGRSEWSKAHSGNLLILLDRFQSFSVKWL